MYLTLKKKFQTYFVKKTKKFFTYHFSFIIRMEQDFYIVFFWIAKRRNHLWKYYIAYVVTTFITLLLTQYGGFWVNTLGVMLLESHTFFLRYAINSNDNANQFCLCNFFGRMKLNEVNLASFVVPLRIPGCIFESLPIMIVSKM